jgi:hypothetical protein
MIWTPLQLSDVGIAQQIRLVGEGVTVVLGLFISYVALQGYRRNRSRPMLFVSVGFFCVVGVPALLFVAFLVFPLSQDVTSNLVQLVEILGMVSILYGLRVEPDR